MNAGLLKNIIVIQYENFLINPYGEKTGIWENKFTTRARIINDSGNRNLENEEIVFNYYKTFQMRSYVPITEDDRIKWDEKYYRVLTIEHRKDLNDIIVKTELINE